MLPYQCFSSMLARIQANEGIWTRVNERKQWLFAVNPFIDISVCVKFNQRMPANVERKTSCVLLDYVNGLLIENYSKTGFDWKRFILLTVHLNVCMNDKEYVILFHKTNSPKDKAYKNEIY